MRKAILLFLLGVVSCSEIKYPDKVYDLNSQSDNSCMEKKQFAVFVENLNPYSSGQNIDVYDFSSGNSYGLIETLPCGFETSDAIIQYCANSNGVEHPDSLIVKDKSCKVVGLFFKN